jgi:hypothetical protein
MNYQRSTAGPTTRGSERGGPPGEALLVAVVVVIVFYAAPLDDGSGYVVHKCARCGHRHVIDGTGVRWLRCGQALIKSSKDKPARSRSMTATAVRTRALAEYRAAAGEEARLAAALTALQSRSGPVDPAVADLQRRHQAAATRAAALRQQLAKRGWPDAL